MLAYYICSCVYIYIYTHIYCEGSQPAGHEGHQLRAPGGGAPAGAVQQLRI